MKISLENNKIVTLLYGKPAFRGVFTNFEIFLTDVYKHGLIGA